MKNIHLYILAIGFSILSCTNSDLVKGKLSKEKEHKILKELRSDLSQNLEDINSNIKSLIISKKANEIVINAKRKNLKYHDSLDFHFANLYPYLVFSPNETTFNYLKTIGMNSISNDSLRASISDLYGVQYGIYKSYESIYFVEHYTNYVKPMFMNEFESFQFYRSFKPRNFNKFISNQDNIGIITYTRDAIDTFIFLQAGLKEDAEQIVAAIDREIKNQ